MDVPAPRTRVAALALALTVGAAVLPAPAAAAPVLGGVGGADVPAPSASGRYRLDLAREGDYVRQATFVQCVGASVQMMLNITRDGANRSQRWQRRLQAVAREFSGPRPAGFGRRRGASVFGWASSLAIHGGGRYRVATADTLQGAMQLAARTIRITGRPVGLLVWRGRHAWVMSGFEATGDPLRDPGVRVTGAYILDPLFPYGSKAWGPSPRPGSLVPVAVIGRQFVHRDTGGPWNALPGRAWLAGKWVLVLPVPSTPPRQRRA